jgi:hypothetical protein
VNVQPPNEAHDIFKSLDSILASPKATPDERQACEVLRKAITHLGQVSQSEQWTPPMPDWTMLG